MTAPTPLDRAADALFDLAPIEYLGEMVPTATAMLTAALDRDEIARAIGGQYPRLAAKQADAVIAHLLGGADRG